MSATPILGPSDLLIAKAIEFARRQGGTANALDLVLIYWRLAADRGVRPEVAYGQMLKETGYGRFGGEVDSSYRNPCGLKTRNASGHQRFPTWEVGVIAHLDHLALYAGAPSYPRHDTPDPRHFPTLLGRAETVEALGGNWAPSPTYGTSLVRLLGEMGRA